MIKANELRVGVLAIESNVNHNGITEKIISVSVKDIMNHQNLYPIPLTEEWLLKFGFEKINSFYIFGDVDRRHFEIKINNGFKVRIFTDLQEYELKYVHQLQNLYFALTGQELELK